MSGMISVKMTPDEYQKYLKIARNSKFVTSHKPVTAATLSPLSVNFSLTGLLYYLGWTVAAIGLTLFMAIGCTIYGSGFATVTGIIYSAGFYWLGDYSWNQAIATSGSTTLGGLLLSLSIMLIPLIICSMHDWVSGSRYNSFTTTTRIQIEVAVFSMASWILYHHQGFAFFVSFIGVATWAFSLDLLDLILMSTARGRITSNHVRRVSEVFGLLMIDVARRLEQNPEVQTDYSFWLYFWGALAFWGGLTTEQGTSKFNKFVYGCLNLGFIYSWTLIQRDIFLYLGLLGIHLYQGQGFFQRERNPNFLPIFDPFRLFQHQFGFLTVFNCLVIGVAYYFENTDQFLPVAVIDVPFWLYLHGGTLLWTHLNSELWDLGENSSEAIWSFYLLFNLGYVATSIYLVRIIFLVLGFFGTIVYIFRLYFKYFENYIGFGIFLTALGVGIMSASQQIQTYYGLD